MRKLILGSFLTLILAAAVPIEGQAFTLLPPALTNLNLTGTVLNAECYARCLRESQADQCRVGDQVICRNECQQTPDVPIYYNGVRIQPQIEYDDNEPIRIVTPSETACGMCMEDNGINQSVPTDNVPRNLNVACVVSTNPSNENLCSALGISTTTAVVHPMNLTEYINLGRLPFNELLWPCTDTPAIDPTTQQFTASYPKCQSSADVAMPPVFGGGNGLGCYETKPINWTAQGCPAAASCCTNTTLGCTRTDTVAPIDTTVGNGIY